MPDSVRYLGKKWQERCAIIVTRLRVGARSDGRTKNRNKPEVMVELKRVWSDEKNKSKARSKPEQARSDGGTKKGMK
ncbi:MAG: hypothetical protein IJC11_05940 [Alphaproteobacteria bacterium]|nr:hypothetical protein [Alphaproteobacteria bacterium]